MLEKPKRFSDYSDEQIEKLGNENFNKLVQKEAKREIPFVVVGFERSVPYSTELFRWESEASPDSPMCLKCYEWKRYPQGQRHFGYTWWRQCSWECDCEHHKTEIWIA